MDLNITNSNRKIWLATHGNGTYTRDLLYNSIDAYDVFISSAFMRINSDTLLLNARFKNPDQHNFNAAMIVHSQDETVKDTIALFDDGSHGDGQAQDGLWGNYIPPMTSEEVYNIDIITFDQDEGGYGLSNNVARFTTIGPVAVENYIITSSDTIANPGDILTFRLMLKNRGLSSTAQNVTSKIAPLDTFALIASSTDPSYGNIQAGSTITANKGQFVRFNSEMPGRGYYTSAFEVRILSDGYVFWKDTVKIVVDIQDQYQPVPYSFQLWQNYPNPFNSITVISYELPVTSHVSLIIFNSLGQIVSSLVSKKQNPGIHELKWDASGISSGVYYYNLITSNGYSETKKLVLLK